jgi:hypothetical protein
MIVAGSSLSIVLNPTHCVEVLLRSGRRLTFGNLLDREGTIRLLRAARTQAQHEQASGLHQWRPRRIELHEPLSVHNLLPCTLHATLTQQGEWRGGGPTATPVRGPEPRVVADAVADAVGGTVGGTAASAAGLLPTELRPALVEVFDWWDPHLKQLTFHAGEAWGREERKDVQFLALGPRAGARDDTVAVLDWWDPQAQKLVFHPEGPRGAEERKAVQFYGLAAPRAGTCPVHEFWNERLGQLTVHAGEPWEGERRGQKLFHAYPSWARLRYSAMPHDAACDAAARRVQAALRGRNSRRALPPRVSTSPPSEPPGWLLARPAYAAPLARVGLSRLRRPELVVAVREYMRHGCSNI